MDIISGLLFYKKTWFWEYLFIKKRHYVGNKAKRRISKRVFQENKARQIFWKGEHFLLPDTHSYVPVLIMG